MEKWAPWFYLILKWNFTPTTKLLLCLLKKSFLTILTIFSKSKALSQQNRCTDLPGVGNVLLSSCDRALVRHSPIELILGFCSQNKLGNKDLGSRLFGFFFDTLLLYFSLFFSVYFICHHRSFFDTPGI